jgi:hypothetical protein
LAKPIQRETDLCCMLQRETVCRYAILRDIAYTGLLDSCRACSQEHVRQQVALHLMKSGHHNMDHYEAHAMAQLAVIKWHDEAATAPALYKPVMGLQGTGIRPSLSVAALAGSRYIAASGKPLRCRQRETASCTGFHIESCNIDCRS